MTIGLQRLDSLECEICPMDFHIALQVKKIELKRDSDC